MTTPAPAPQPHYTPEQRRRILSIARQAVRTALESRRAQRPADIAESWLLEPRGCFVTLTRRGDLRGCIGTFEANRPLIDNILEMSGASTRDPRFVHDSVTLAELMELTIEVSILTPMQRIDDPRKFRLGVDGIYLKHTHRRVSGCFLPQVAIEQGWNVEQTLDYCCSHKMGLPPETWRDSIASGGLECYVFQSTIISESEHA